MTENVQWSLACGDVVPGCPTTFTAATKEEILEQAAPHAAAAHGLTEIDEPTKNAVLAAMKPVG
jgi:predicted small metal-binding protein